jgi:hypothetical protein
MTKIDLERERRRLVEFYSGQMDGELENVAAEAYQLTEVAREALRAEISRRDLQAEVVENAPVIIKKEPRPMPGDPPPPKPPADPLPPGGEFELRPWITIRKFRDLPEALLAKGTLDSAGIEAVLSDDNVVRMDWFWSNLMGGIKLSVDQEDVEVANGILDQPIPEGFNVRGLGEYEQPRCPNCQSLDINYRELNRPVAFVSAYFNLPLPVRRRAWRCHSCYTQWEEVEDHGANESNS